MMVEAGVKILPEDVMAEAILFGHRSLLPLIDLQEKLRELVGKPKRAAVPRAAHGLRAQVRRRWRRRAASSSSSTSRRPAPIPKMADLVEVAAVRVKGGKITDRWSTLVNPGRPIVGNQMHGITDKDVKGAPSPAEAARKALDFVGDAPFVGHSVGFDIAFLEEALGDGTRVEPGPLPRHAGHRPRGLPGPRELQARRRWPASSASSSPQSHRALPDAEATANLLIWFGNDLPGRIDALEAASPTAIRATRSGRTSRPALLEAARREARFSKSLFGLVQKKTVRELVLDEGIRMDGRATDEIRPISVEVGLLPRAHGSGLFTRGQTQALTVATLGPSSDVQRIDTISPETEKRYLHHYNFPPYSTGENKPMRGPSPPRHRARQPRRARAAAGPADARRSSRTSSASSPRCVAGNGSTSMASTCGSTLALMDAGVPIKAPVAGAAMGLVLDAETGNFVVLTDILGKEDSIGDMDFKVTGTTDGHHRPPDGHQGQGHRRAGHPRGPQAGPRRPPVHPGQDDRGPAGGPRGDVRLRPADHHDQDQPREDPRDHRQGWIDDPQDPGGDRDRDQRRGRRHRGDRGRLRRELAQGDQLDREPDPRGRGRRPVPRQGHPADGLRRFVEILPGKEGLVRIGELADYHVPSVEDVVSVGDEVMVVVTEIDRQGRVNLSRKAAMQRHLAK